MLFNYILFYVLPSNLIFSFVFGKTNEKYTYKSIFSYYFVNKLIIAEHSLSLEATLLTLF
jgi:hypothetical protein